MPSLFPSLRGRARGEAFNKMNRDTALVVFSGGQDSTTCLFWAKREFKKVYALSFLYGQKHQKEVDLARAIARKAGVEFEVMDVSFIGRLGHNSLTDAGMEMDQEKPADSFPNTFVPGRNLSCGWLVQKKKFRLCCHSTLIFKVNKWIGGSDFLYLGDTFEKEG